MTAIQSLPSKIGGTHAIVAGYDCTNGLMKGGAPLPDSVTHNVGKIMRYTTAIEAFLDLVYLMNQGATGKVYAFQTTALAKVFVGQLSSITQRRIISTRTLNEVEVRICS